MATEFRLGYTGVEINQKLAKVDEIEIALENEYYTSTDIDTKINEVNTSIETSLQAKADLVDGKVPLDQLPDDIGSGGGASSWNDLQDKPFEEIAPAQTITWDGNTDGLLSTSIDLDMGEGNILTFACYKISDIIVTEELIKGTSFDCTTPDGSLSCEVDMVSGKTPNGSFYATNSQVEIPFIYVVNQANDSVIYNGDPTFTLVFPETGVWFLRGTVEGSVFMQTSSLTVPAIIKTLDSKYIADMYYDTRKIYHFDSSKTPNPPSYPIPGFGVNGYKIFDLTPTLEEFSNYKIIKDGTTELTFANQQIILSWDGAWMIQSDTSYYFGLCLRSGTFEAEFQGMSVVCEVPEPGIYFMYNELPSNITFEINLGGELKQIDPKFIPADLDFNLDDYYTKSEVYNKNETYSKGEVYTKSEVDVAIENNIEDIVIDPIPTQGSKNPVESSGVHSALVELENRVTSTFFYKGTKENYSDLPMTGNAVGDIWNILNPDPAHDIEPGDNVAWDGTKWDVLAGIMDMSSYYTKAEVDNIALSGEVNLSNYYTKPETHLLIENEINSIDLSNYYTKSEVDSALDNVSVDLSGYYTKSEINNGYYTKTEIDNIIGDVDAVLDEIDVLIGE